MESYSRRIRILTAISLLALFAYLLTRLYYFSHVSIRWPDIIFAALLLLGEFHMLLHSIGFGVNNILLARHFSNVEGKKFKKGGWPEVAVVVATRNEPAAVIEQTFITLLNIDYENFRIYLVDGSNDEKIISSNKYLCRKFGVKHYKQKRSVGGKAGGINDFARDNKAKYIFVLDADQNPMPNVLKKLVAVAETDKNIAFVQTPQYYSNIDVSHVAMGAAMQQTVFFEMVCEAKNRINATFCCGTNVLISREALLAIGGFDETSITEDFATSLDWHAAGYRSVYVNNVEVFGMAPESLPAYFKQQFRWAAGTFGVLRKLFKKFFENPRALSPGQWWEYFMSGSYYFVGWAVFFLMLSPIIFLLFERPSYFMDIRVYAVAFLPYYLLTLVVFIGTMRKKNYTVGQTIRGMVINNLNFPILMKATVSGLLNLNLKFVVTAKGVSEKVPFLQLWPWLIMMLLNVLAFIVGVLKFWGNPLAYGINMFWCLYHLWILSNIFYLNQLPKLPGKPAYKV